MMDWQKIVREATKEAASARWRDYALTRLPEVSGFTLSKPKGFGAGTEAVYTGQTRAGIPLKVTVDKSKGVWRAEAGGLFVEDDIVDLDADAVQHALGEAAEALDQHIAEGRRRKTGTRRGHTGRGVRKLSGAGMRLHEPTCPECGEPARGTFERLTGCAEFDVAPGPGADVEYQGTTDIWWDDQRTALERDGEPSGPSNRPMVCCTNGHNWPTAIDNF
jgi:hypothetical protein